ncbi:MAG: pyridoxal phosphate-dependent aminotransferase [Rikenellaceae bacterium]|jgi:cystathionine beta-lyase|nr:pyridoxal phosphate-dependent aminotransferase [Rikenellaceae bacterium]
MRKDNYNFDTIPLREGTNTLKYDARGEVFGCEGVIPMWIADMDFECPAAIGEAIRRRAEHNVYGYDFGGEVCSPSLIGWFGRRTGWKIASEWLRYTPGVVTGLGFAIRAFAGKGQGVVIQPPVYHPFSRMIEANSRFVVNNPLKQVGDRFEMDFADLDRKLVGAQAIILCNPHNPVGRVWTEAELRQVGELCVKHDVTIISDEIHSDLVFAPARHCHIASLDPRFAERTVTFVAPSKTFNIAGLATSAAIIPSERLRAVWDKEWETSHVIGGTVFGHVALRAAYDQSEEWLEELLPYLRANIDHVRSFIAENIPQVGTFEHQGTYLMWLDFRGLGFGSQKELNSWLVDEARLGLNSGADFGREGIGFARMNVATNRTTLNRALEQLAGAVLRK